MGNDESEERLLKTAELAFTDFYFQFICNFSNFTGGDIKGFGNCQSTGAKDAIFFGRPV
jgi:hypothetical protein